MRLETAGEAKGSTRRHPDSDLPKVGTQARVIYDLLKDNYGRPTGLDVRALGLSNSSRAIDDLKDYYGCDIRRVSHKVYILTGEWIGAHFTDYVLQRENEKI